VKKNACISPAISGFIDLNHELTIRYAGATDAGICRTHNEDCLGVQPDLFLFCVADGVGGMDAGEVASHAAIEFLVKNEGVSRNCLFSLFSRMIGHRESKISPLCKQIELAGKYVFELSAKLQKRMATTIVALRSLPDGTAEIGNIGDSRAYLYRKNILGQISDDHSVTNELLRAGLSIKADPSFNAAHKITKALGGKIGEATPDIFRVPFQENDLFLLCSDGLTDMVSDYDISDIIKKCQQESLSTMVGDLIQNAIKAGGRDNITAVLVRVEPKKTVKCSNGAAELLQKAY